MPATLMKPPKAVANVTASRPRAEKSDESAAAPIDARRIPAWATSVAVHVVFLLALSTITLTTTFDREADIVVVDTLEQLDPEAYKFQATVVDQVGGDGVSLTSSQDVAQVVSHAPQEEMRNQLAEEVLAVRTEPSSEIAMPQEEEFADSVDVAGATEIPGGVEGAIDRLTFEIAGSLKENKTLVVWMFDESGSLLERRNTIADRFENIYRQLGVLQVDAERALKTAVVSFGDKTHVHTEDPVDDISGLPDVIRNLAIDVSGKENVFAAVELVANKWLKYRTAMRRNVMIIIVTDERGDDFDKLEEVIALTKRYGMRCYCVGNAAPLGLEKGWVKWTYEDGFVEDLPIDQGPETVAPERVQLPFWGVPGFGRDDLSSGYGPYALTRLCAETQGLYLITDEGRGVTFDRAVMRNYLPDYRPIRFYQRELTTNLAKGKLVEAARMTVQQQLPQLQLTFRADNDNVLREQVAEAQKPAAVVDFELAELYKVLAPGERDRDKLTDPRWQAGFDLAMGRVLAMRVRFYGYNVMLAQMKSTPKTFATPGNNTWHLVPSADIEAGAQIRKMAQQAKVYLVRVVDKHDGTPWGLLAERELSAPLGWAWKESHVDYAPAREGADPKMQVLFAEDDPKKAAQKKAMNAKRVRPQL